MFLRGKLPLLGHIKIFPLTSSVVTPPVEEPTTSEITWNAPSGSMGSYQSGGLFSQALSATSSLGRPITYTLSAGTLPAGVSLAGNTLSGTLTGGTLTYTFVISATDGLGVATREFTVSVTSSVVKASPSNFSSLVRNGNTVNDLQDVQENQNGFRLVLANSFGNLGADLPSSYFLVNFDQAVTMKWIAPIGSYGGQTILYVEYLQDGEWVLAATYTRTNLTWAVNSTGNSTQWRVYASNAGMAGIGNLDIVTN